MVLEAISKALAFRKWWNQFMVEVTRLLIEHNVEEDVQAKVIANLNHDKKFFKGTFLKYPPTEWPMHLTGAVETSIRSYYFYPTREGSEFQRYSGFLGALHDWIDAHKIQKSTMVVGKDIDDV